jgi:hypothetical protein
MLAGQSATAAPPAQTRYHNERWGFCIAYPSILLPYEGVNKAGVSLTYPSDRHGRNPITVGALPNMESSSEPGRQMTLEENADSDFASIGDGEVPPLRNVRVVSKKEILLAGIPALRMQVTYTRQGVERMEDTIYAIKDHAVYSLELKCRLRDRTQYEETFRSVMESFQWGCR